MIIERVETYPLLYKLGKPYGDANGYKKYRTCFLIRIITDNGVDGWGECIDWLPTLQVGFKERLIPFLIGKKVTDRTMLVKKVKKWHRRASSSISMALTEIVAKSANLSVCDYWGGRWRETIPVYASFQSYTDSPDWINHSIKIVEKALNDGFGHAKIKVGGRAFHEDLEHVISIMDMVDGHAQVAIDANQSYDLATSKKWIPTLQMNSNYMWFEEPMPVDQVTDYKIFRAQSPVAIAGGENLMSAAQLLPLLRESAVDIIQPDVMHMDGVDEFRSAMQLSRHFGIRTSPHVFDGALTRLYALFAQANLSPWSKMNGEEIEPIEWDAMENPFTMLVNVKPSKGMVTLPEGPGIGVELDMDLIQAHLWDGESYIE